LAADAIESIEQALADKARQFQRERAERQELRSAEYIRLDMTNIDKSNSYESTHTISYIELFGHEIEMGEDTDLELPYYVETNGRGEKNFGIRTDDFAEALKAYGEQLIIAANEILHDREEKSTSHGVGHIKLTAAHCLPDRKNADFTGKLIIVDSKYLLPEYRSSEHQLVVCTHGSGAMPNAKGISVFCKELFSGDTVVYGRHDILGVADEGNLPCWAKAKRAIQNENKVETMPTQALQSKHVPSLLDEINDAKTEAVARNAATNAKAQTKNCFEL
jgi:hypothetical protein